MSPRTGGGQELDGAKLTGLCIVVSALWCTLELSLEFLGLARGANSRSYPRMNDTRTVDVDDSAGFANFFTDLVILMPVLCKHWLYILNLDHTRGRNSRLPPPHKHQDRMGGGALVRGGR